MAPRGLPQADFRGEFPALADWAWLDTPGSPPASRAVADALRAALDAWEAGDFSWQDWDAAPERARAAFASLVGVDESRVSVMGSVAEGVSTVAAALGPGSIVVADDEYRSVLYPLLARGSGRHEVIRVRSEDGVVRTERLVAAMRPDTVLVAASDTLSSSGQRIDAAALRSAADAVGAQMLLDLTQSMGVLQHDLARTGPDYVVVHGYKWLLCPRGAAWLITAAERLAQLSPLLPSWKSTDPPYGYFGGALDLPATASRLDTSPAWFSWVGAEAALGLMAQLDPVAVEAHCVRLARRWWTGARELGLRPVLEEQDSHIAVVDAGDRAEAIRDRLALAHVKASSLGGRLRVGIHYFVDDDDIDRALDAMSAIKEAR